MVGPCLAYTEGIFSAGTYTMTCIQKWESEQTKDTSPECGWERARKRKGAGEGHGEQAPQHLLAGGLQPYSLLVSSLRLDGERLFMWCSPHSTSLAKKLIPGKAQCIKGGRAAVGLGGMWLVTFSFPDLTSFLFHIMDSSKKKKNTERAPVFSL